MKLVPSCNLASSLPVRGCLLAALTVILALGAGPAGATVVNLSTTATGFGLLPDTSPLSQGTVAGIANGQMFDWASTSGTSPREFALSNLQPYMTWGSDQQVRTVRVWSDVSTTYDRVRIDTLTPGGTATVEGDWINRYDSGTGLGQRFQDVDLGSTYTTRGVRTRVDKTTADINVGEVAVFNPLDLGGTLTAARVFPTSVAASSVGFGAVAANASNTTVNWYNRWLGGTPAANPGSDYTYDMFFTNAALDAVSLTFARQCGISEIPSSWELLVDTGSGLTSLGTYTTTVAQDGNTRGMYYLNIGSLQGVDQLRLRVAEANVPGGLAVGLMEFEALHTIPEPCTTILLATGALLLCRQRRK